jgi:hypothetical protein
MSYRLAPKVKRREATRERKAEAAARVERAIEKELIEVGNPLTKFCSNTN